MKKCNLCQETKPLDAFHKAKKGKHGRHGRCKDCRSLTESDYRKEYYYKNRTELRAKQKEYNKENKDAIDATRARWYAKNKDKLAEQKKEYYESNKDNIRDKRLKHRYEITPEQYDKMLKEQDYVCAICKQHNATGKSLSVDHNHKCCPGKKSCGDCVRALLCFKCNTTLGRFGDNPQLLRQAAEYIEKYKTDLN